MLVRGLQIVSVLLLSITLAGCTSPTATPNQPATPALTSTPTPTSTPTSGQITSVDVASHNSPSSCWIVISGQVYDVTKYTPNHPGGEKILTGCGKDMTSYMENTHKPVDDKLPQFLIGPLKP